MAELVSIREFARREGCAESLVRRGVKEGRLQLQDAKLDAALVGTAWRKGNAARAVAEQPDVDSTHGAASREQTPWEVLLPSSSKEFPPRVADGETLREAAERLAAGEVSIPLLGISLAKKEHFLALLRELEYRQKEGALVELEFAQSVLFEEFRAQRDSWLNWPAKVGPELAADLGVAADRVTELLSAHVHKHIRGLGEPDGRFSKD